MERLPYAREGFTTITPYLLVQGVPALLDFLATVFGATEGTRVLRKDGTVRHTEARIGNAVIEMADAAGLFPVRPATIHIYVPDADATFERAVKAGAKPIFEPGDTDYGDRLAGITDPFDNVWYIGTWKGAPSAS